MKFLLWWPVGDLSLTSRYSYMFRNIVETYAEIYFDSYVVAMSSTTFVESVTIWWHKRPGCYTDRQYELRRRFCSRRCMNTCHSDRKKTEEKEKTIEIKRMLFFVKPVSGFNIFIIFCFVLNLEYESEK